MGDFIITPHTKNIIVGRKEGRGESDVLICAAKNCLHKSGATETILINDNKNGMTNLNPVLIDPNFGKEIEVTGFITCPRCEHKVSYPEDLGEFNPEKQEATNLICPICKKILPLKDSEGKFTVTWTQRVVSKHRRKKHYYYHGECFDALFLDSKDEE